MDVLLNPLESITSLRFLQEFFLKYDKKNDQSNPWHVNVWPRESIYWLDSPFLHPYPWIFTFRSSINASSSPITLKSASSKNIQKLIKLNDFRFSSNQFFFVIIIHCNEPNDYHKSMLYEYCINASIFEKVPKTNSFLNEFPTTRHVDYLASVIVMMWLFLSTVHYFITIAYSKSKEELPKLSFDIEIDREETTVNTGSWTELTSVFFVKQGNEFFFCVCLSASSWYKCHPFSHDVISVYIF